MKLGGIGGDGELGDDWQMRVMAGWIGSIEKASNWTALQSPAIAKIRTSGIAAKITQVC